MPDATAVTDAVTDAMQAVALRWPSAGRPALFLRQGHPPFAVPTPDEAATTATRRCCQ